MSDVGTLTVRTNTEGHLGGLVWRAGEVYANMSDLECVWLWEPVPEVSAVELPVGLRHPTSLFSMVMYGDAGAGTFFPLSPRSIFKPPTLIGMAEAASLGCNHCPLENPTEKDWRREGRREKARSAFWSRKASPRTCEEAERREGRKQDRKTWQTEREKKGRSWKGNCDVSSPAPGEMEEYRWSERNWMGNSCRGLWMEIDSWIVGKKGLGDGGEYVWLTWRRWGGNRWECWVRRRWQRSVDIRAPLVVV